MPTGKTIIHATLDPADLNKSVACEQALIGDAKLTLAHADRRRAGSRLDGNRAIAAPVARGDRRSRGGVAGEWLPLLTRDDDAAHSLSRALGSAAHGRRGEHDHHPRRRQPARPALALLEDDDAAQSYIGWGKTTQLGYGLGLAMGAKLACPDKLCINVWGDAAIGFTGMDFETAVRERMPILSILLNNSAMAVELRPDAGRHRALSLDRHIGRLCRLRPRAGRLWRAGDRARGDCAGDPTRHRRGRSGPAGAGRVHHLPETRASRL